MSSRPLVLCGILFLLLFSTTASQAQGTITNITPMSGVAGTQITITGQGLHPNWSGILGCTINGLGGATPTVWTDTQIVVTIPSTLPANTTTIPIAVDCWDEWDDYISNVVNWTLLQAVITSINPNTGLPNSDVVISGSGFGATPGSVAFKNAVATVKSWSDTQIVVTVPQAAQTGPIAVSVPGLSPSNSSTFFVLPHIDSIAPASGTVGTQITLTGQSLAQWCPENGLFFGSVAAPILSWTDTQIIATVPEGLPNGVTSFQVHANMWDGYECVSGTNSLNFNLTVVPPAITSISPTSGAVGSTVTITGSGFGATQGTSAVLFNGASAPVTNWSDTQVVAVVPSSATSGPVTITTSAGTTSGPMSFTVTHVLTNLSVTPSNPTVALDSTDQLKLLALGTYSDGTTEDISSSVSWNSSNTSIASVITIPGVFGVISPNSAGVTTISATMGTFAASTTVTVTNPPPKNTPSITEVSPNTGAAGTQVTITGADFGASQGSGAVWLGTTYGTVLSWSDTQVIAQVSYGSMNGTAKLQQAGTWSNAVDFSVPTPIVSSVSPDNGLPGTQVTVTGSGFGAEPATGQIVLGTVPGFVVSWSDSQIVATVAEGSRTGLAQVLQGGVSSNGLTFTINVPTIESVSPGSGTPGTLVTITGSGFGATQGSGNVWLGSAPAAIVSWSDSVIQASVAQDASNGTAKVFGNGMWSNSVPFAVPRGYSTTGVTLNPASIALVVGETYTFQALDQNGAELQDLAWTSSDTSLVSLSTDNPPVLTALAPGRVTINAGDGSAEVTIYPGPMLPEGTVKWTIPGEISEIIPAVPSSSGAADVFAFIYPGKVLAVKSDGKIAWTANMNTQLGTSVVKIPDFQGGLIYSDGYSLTRLDGLNGQPVARYDYTMPSADPRVVAHTDGTIFTVDGANVIGIDPSNGQKKFEVTLETSLDSSNGNCGEYARTESSSPPDIGSPIIAGDGFAYVPYMYSFAPLASNDHVCTETSETWTGNYELNLKVVRIGSDGSATKIPIGEWRATSVRQCVDSPEGGRVCTDASSGAIPETPYFLLPQAKLITDSDQGASFSWELKFPGGPATQKLTVLSGGSKVSEVALGSHAAWMSVEPILQQEDGGYIGVQDDSNTSQITMLAFDKAGKLKWSVPNYWPEIATAGGGVIAESVEYHHSVGFDGNGKALGTFGKLPLFSWIGSAYQSASMTFSQPPEYASTYGATRGGNASGKGTAVKSTAYPRMRSCFMKDGTSTCPYDYLLVALQTLQTRVAGDCPDCIRYVFDKIRSRTDQLSFSKFIGRFPPLFFDGTKSSLKLYQICDPDAGSDLVSYDAGFGCYARDVGYGHAGDTVADYFASNPGLVALAMYQAVNAQAPNGSVGLKIFFNPSKICMTEISSTSTCQVLNESMLFHEGLHEFYSLSDSAIQRLLGLPVKSCTANISDYISFTVFTTSVNSCGP